MSHSDAISNSFKISVESLDDYDLLISGKLLPKYVKVKEFVYHSGDFKRVDRSSYVNDPNYNASISSSSSSNNIMNTS